MCQRGCPPKELFMHGRIMITDEEYKNFKKAAGQLTNIVAIQIQEERNIRLYRLGKQPVLRGSALLIDRRSGLLWTKGFTPRLQTYPGREVPFPLYLRITHGDADIVTVMSDIMALTKLNYNACIFQMVNLHNT